MNKKKIAFCIPTMITGGVEFVLIRTLEELSKNPDFKITVMTHNKIKEAVFLDWFVAHPDIEVIVTYPLLDWFQDLRKYTKIFPLENIRKIIFSVYKKIKWSQLKKSEFDLFIDYKNFSFFKELKHRKTKSISWFHGSINFFKKNNYIQYLNSYDKVIALSESFVKDFKIMYLNYSNQVMHFYNPIALLSIQALADSTEAPTYSGDYFCAVSRHDRDKDIETIIRAFDSFFTSENQPDVKLILVGDGPSSQEFKDLAKKMKSEKNIIFVGNAKNPFGYMKNSIAHIMSSYNEGLPTVLIEAQTLSVLNIASDCKSGTGEILLNGDAGLLFTPGDTNQLATIMSDVWNNRVDRKTMLEKSTNGLSRFESVLIAKQIEELIYSITKNK